MGMDSNADSIYNLIFFLKGKIRIVTAEEFLAGPKKGKSTDGSLPTASHHNPLREIQETVQRETQTGERQYKVQVVLSFVSTKEQ